MQFNTLTLTLQNFITALSGGLQPHPGLGELAARHPRRHRGGAPRPLDGPWRRRQRRRRLQAHPSHRRVGLDRPVVPDAREGAARLAHPGGDDGRRRQRRREPAHGSVAPRRLRPRRDRAAHPEARRPRDDRSLGPHRLRLRLPRHHGVLSHHGHQRLLGRARVLRVRGAGGDLPARSACSRRPSSSPRRPSAPSSPRRSSSWSSAL